MIDEKTKYQRAAPKAFHPSRTLLEPATDIYETDAEIIIVADLPGVRVSDLDVDLDGSLLTVRGKVRSEEDPENSLVLEYSAADYYRVYSIGPEIDPSGVTADLTDGVLEIRIKKRDRAQVKKIPISY
jgi:HSP20 family protein